MGLLNLRNALMAGRRTPTFISGIRSDGNAYILLDNAVSANNDIEMTLDVSIPSDYQLDGGHPFAGVVTGSPTNYRSPSFLMQWGGISVGSGFRVPAFYGFVSNWMSAFNAFYNPFGTVVSCKLSAKSGRAEVSTSINGQIVERRNQSYTGNVFSSPIGIFSVPYCITDGVKVGMVSVPQTCFVLHGTKISIDGNLLYDLLPCVVGGSALLYNQVNSQIVSNAGTGNFIPIV